MFLPVAEWRIQAGLKLEWNATLRSPSHQDRSCCSQQSGATARIKAETYCEVPSSLSVAFMAIVDLVRFHSQQETYADQLIHTFDTPQ